MLDDNKLICPKCKSLYDSNTKFCTRDGSKLVEKDSIKPRCVICDTPYDDKLKFCPKDGGKIKVPKKKRNNFFTKNLQFLILYFSWLLFNVFFLLCSKNPWGDYSDIFGFRKLFFPFSPYNANFFYEEKNLWTYLQYSYDYTEFIAYLFSPILIWLVVKYIDRKYNGILSKLSVNIYLIIYGVVLITSLFIHSNEYQITSHKNYRYSIIENCNSNSQNPNLIVRSLKLGNQEWMISNLDTEYFCNGELIPQSKNDSEWNNAGFNEEPTWCYFNFDSLNSSRGKIYNWYAVNDSRSLAPKGWHIPTKFEWKILEDHLKTEEISFRSTEYSRFSQWKPSYDMEIKYTGVKIASFDSNKCYFWCSDDFGDNYANVVNGFASRERLRWSKSCGFSVICLKN